ncbi:uncharacterized protein LOC129587419 [Paramacrobiotus metropolitanus]|uniref:uncharacterized protein LOC129587419 n=1 Tax=Paramacrobiotus metropolitanus TaxID=2943436 RepID=UPI002446330F|nr:uncharacterized protein LOC129587419 [Paramacrobiotus metropolitanus]
MSSRADSVASTGSSSSSLSYASSTSSDGVYRPYNLVDPGCPFANACLEIDQFFHVFTRTPTTAELAAISNRAFEIATRIRRDMLARRPNVSAMDNLPDAWVHAIHLANMILGDIQFFHDARLISLVGPYGPCAAYNSVYQFGVTGTVPYIGENTLPTLQLYAPPNPPPPQPPTGFYTPANDYPPDNTRHIYTPINDGFVYTAAYENVYSPLPDDHEQELAFSCHNVLAHRNRPRWWSTVPLLLTCQL